MTTRQTIPLLSLEDIGQMLRTLHAAKIKADDYSYGLGEVEKRS